MWGPQGFNGNQDQSDQVQQAAPDVTSSTKDQSMDQSFDGTPVMPVYSAEILHSLSTNKFQSYRRKSQKYGKCLMYYGYIGLVIGALSLALRLFVLYEIIGLQFNDGNSDQKNGMLFECVIIFMDTINLATGILSNCYLVKATKIPVRQISQQTYDSNTGIEKYQEVVHQIKLYILLIFVTQLFITALTGFVAYESMNNYFQDQYKHNLNEYKNATISDERHEYDERQMNLDLQAQSSFTYYGPVNILKTLAFDSCWFGTIYFCYVKYMKNLTRFENSPQNPANSKAYEHNQI